MTIDEQVRHDLFTGLRDAVGVEPAKLMMTAVPPFSWNEIATKADLAQFATRDEMLATRDEMHVEFVAVRNEMKFEFAAVRNEMTSEFAAVRNEMKLEFASVRLEFAAIRLEMSDANSQMHRQMAKNIQNLFFQIAAFNISTAGIVIAALHYLI